MPPGSSPRPPAPSSGGKGPTKHPGFIVPQKEGTNYLATLRSTQGENERPVGWRREMGWGALEEGREKATGYISKFSAIWGWGKESLVLM